MKNVIFMGTPDFAVGTLKALIASDYTVQAVFTQPDKPKGRGKALQMPPVKEAALEAGIPVYQPRRIRDAGNFEILKGYAPDVIVVVAFGQLIPKEILELPPYGCVNVHASLLPRYRGAAPIQWAVINGDSESGVTTMRMDEGLDTGDMLCRTVVSLDERETGGSLFDKLSEAGAKLLIETLRELEAGSIVPEKQPEESPTPYAAMLTKQMGRIEWGKDARAIECLIRGLDPWPSAYTSCHGKTLKLWRARAEEAQETQPGVTREGTQAAQPGAAGEEAQETQPGAAGEEAQAAQPGTIVEVTKNTLKIQTGKGILAVEELQLEGKKRMDVAAFLRGFPLKPGERLL